MRSRLQILFTAFLFLDSEPFPGAVLTVERELWECFDEARVCQAPVVQVGSLSALWSPAT